MKRVFIDARVLEAEGWEPGTYIDKETGEPVEVWATHEPLTRKND